MTGTLPPLPIIDSLSWAPPVQTDPDEISRVTKPLVIHADSDNSSWANDVWDVPGGSPPFLANWWESRPPEGRQLVLRQFWKLVPGTFTHLSQGTHLSKTWEYMHGVTKTDSQSIAVEIGVAVEGLSAGLSATFSHSIEITDQQTQTTQFNVDPPPSGTRIWLLWDLMYEFSIVYPNTNSPIPAGTYRGDVDFSEDRHYSGAFLNYAWTHLIISSGNLVSQDKVFPDS